ncbi:MAG: SpaA isopeptide-forming pilin-related protein [Atopobiaceae bacterium]|nr:SpaA isopeptide-forming pilin-related protein [Atopobiaceae bacterium]
MRKQRGTHVPQRPYRPRHLARRQVLTGLLPLALVVVLLVCVTGVAGGRATAARAAGTPLAATESAAVAEAATTESTTAQATSPDSASSATTEASASSDADTAAGTEVADSSDAGIMLMSDDEGLMTMATDDVDVVSWDTTNSKFVEGSQTTMTAIKGAASQWASSEYGTSIAGFAMLADGSISGASFSAGTYSKYMCSTPLDGTPTTSYALALDGTSFASGTGTTTFENMTINLTNGSHLDCSSGGSLVFKNCTITIDGTSYITSAGSLSLDGCTVTGSKGSATDIQLTGGTCALTGTDAFTGCSIDTAKAASITTSGTTTLTDCALTGTTDRTTSLVSLTGGTTTVGGTTTITGIGDTANKTAGAVFNVTGGATLNLAGGTISNCNISAPRDFIRGGAVAYVDSGTINLTGTTVSGCGNGNSSEYSCGPFSVSGTGKMNMSGGTIENCKGSHGGAVSVFSSTGSFSMTGGTISGCSAWFDGGAIFTSVGTVSVGGTAQITGNSSGRNGAAISARTSSTVTISGSPVITGNNCTGTETTGGSTVGAVGGFNAGSHGIFYISGTPTITGNTYKGGTTSEEKADLAVYDTTSLKVGDMGAAASVGICSPNANLLKSGVQFATTSPETANTTSGLNTFFNDKNTTGGITLIGASGTASAVVWGQGTCQIIRDGKLVGIYASLTDACASAQSDDRIEVYKSHTLTSAATLPSTVTGVTITTAPTDTATATGAHVFEPATGESDEAAVSRATSYAGTMLSVAGAYETMDNLVIDGASTAASSTVTIASGASLTLKDAAVQNCRTASGAGAVSVADGGALKVTGLVLLHGNTASADTTDDNNVSLSSGGLIQVIDSLTAGSSIGVTVPTAQHVAYHAIAKGYASGAESTTVAAASVGYFFDDTNPVLGIGANSVTGHADLDTFVYFEPPTKLQFYKTTSATDGLPLAGATFHLYRYIGSGTPPTGYLTDAELAADTSNWTIVPNSATKTNDYTSTSTGLVDCGGLDDGYGRIVEVTTPTGFTAPTCEWQVCVNSAAADPNKFVFTQIDESTTTVNVFSTTYDADTGTTTYTLPNTPETGILYVGKTVAGDYGDKTRSFSFTANFSDACTGRVYDADGNQVGSDIAFDGDIEKSFTLADGQYLVATNLELSTTCVVIETDAQASGSSSSTPYVCSMAQRDGSVGYVSMTPGTKLATVTFTKAGMTGVDFTNTRTAVVATGVHSNDAAWVGFVVGVGLVLAVVLALRLRRRRA